jgi:hypothetical protein
VRCTCYFLIRLVMLTLNLNISQLFPRSSELNWNLQVAGVGPGPYNAAAAAAGSAGAKNFLDSPLQFAELPGSPRLAQYSHAKHELTPDAAPDPAALERLDSHKVSRVCLVNAV